MVLAHPGSMGSYPLNAVGPKQALVMEEDLMSLAQFLPWNVAELRRSVPLRRVLESSVSLVAPCWSTTSGDRVHHSNIPEGSLERLVPLVDSMKASAKSFTNGSCLHYKKDTEFRFSSSPFHRGPAHYNGLQAVSGYGTRSEDRG